MSILKAIKKVCKILSKIKICGMKDEANTALVSSLDIDYLGLIFAPSIRQVSPQKACKLASIIHENKKLAIGVFVDEDDEFILQCVQKARLDGVQIYKNISKTLFSRLKELGLEVWQVLSVGENLNLPQNLNAHYLAFDTKGLLKGGNGVSFDWNLLKNYDKDFVLAGGIGLENIEEALKFKPYVVDINSKVEDKEHLKRLDLIEEIITKVKK